jgi:hypothetical protein
MNSSSQLAVQEQVATAERETEGTSGGIMVGDRAASRPSPSKVTSPHRHRSVLRLAKEELFPILQQLTHFFIVGGLACSVPLHRKSTSKMLTFSNRSFYHPDLTVLLEKTMTTRTGCESFPRASCRVSNRVAPKLRTFFKMFRCNFMGSSARSIATLCKLFFIALHLFRLSSGTKF